MRGGIIHEVIGDVDSRRSETSRGAHAPRAIFAHSPRGDWRDRAESAREEPRTVRVVGLDRHRRAVPDGTLGGIRAAKFRGRLVRKRRAARRERLTLVAHARLDGDDTLGMRGALALDHHGRYHLRSRDVGVAETAQRSVRGCEILRPRRRRRWILPRVRVGGDSANTRAAAWYSNSTFESLKTPKTSLTSTVVTPG